MTETGIYGGSFNPIHKGHVELGDFLCRTENLDEIWFMVSPQNPFKKTAPDLLDENARLELVRTAVRTHPRLKACDFEFRLPRPSFTADTLCALRDSFPHRRFALIIGADNWLSFDHWRRPDEILRHHRIIVYPRPGYEMDASRLPSGVSLAETPLIPISSTDIRRTIAQGGDASGMLDQAVWEEICRKGYYKTTAEDGQESLQPEKDGLSSAP